MRYRFLRFPGDKLKAVTFSFDDGCREDIKLAALLDSYNCRCTFNVNSGFIKNPGNKFLNFDEVKKYLSDTHHEIAVHGDKHRAPGVNTPIDIIQDVLDCRKQLENMFGKIIRGMAYPDSGIGYFDNGTTYSDVKRILTDCGIVYSRSLKRNDSFRLPADWHNWEPTIAPGDSGYLELAEKFAALSEENCTNSNAGPRLFYAWGHGYDIDTWLGDALHKLCGIIANKEDTWYATNIEIYEYVTAYQSLIFSADGRICYNPTLHKIWFVVDGKHFSIEPGETINLDV